jgi:endonuclease/exonuclease/phosphatase family metal-dependent hydrolase
MDFKKKYLKYKYKYLSSKQSGGGRIADNLNLGVDGMGEVISYNRPNILPDSPYFLNNEKNKRKKDYYNASPDSSYSPFPAFDSPHAYMGENLYLSRVPKYCDLVALNPPKKNGEIRIISYNVHNWVQQCKTGPMTQNVGRDHRKAIDYAIRLDGDIIFLQEIVPVYDKKPETPEEIEQGSFNPIIDTFDDFGYHYYHIGDTHYSMKNNDNLNKLDMQRPYFMLCNAIFSKHEIIEKEIIELGNNRIALKCLIKTPNGHHLACYNVHLEFDSRLKDFKRNMEYKQIQLNKIAKKIYEDSRRYNQLDNIHYILGGDFNNPIGKGIFGQPLDFKPLDMMLKYVKPVMHVYNPENMPIPQVSGLNQSSIIDHFFIDKETNVRNNQTYISPAPASDHYPIFIDLVL